MLGIVTIRFPRNSKHNPQRKIMSSCPFSKSCSDSTGEHHSYLERGEDMNEIWAKARKKLQDLRIEKTAHITRVEAVDTGTNTLIEV